MGVYTKKGRRIADLRELWHRGSGGHPAHIYGKDKQEIVLDVPTLADRSWVALGDSLTDDTGACGTNVPNKYHKLIRDEVGMTVTVHAKGGTGYWRTAESGTCFYQRLSALSPDPTVDIVTLFGSVNDYRVFRGISQTDAVNYNLPNLGFDKNGVMMTFADWHDPNSPRFHDPYHIRYADAQAQLALTDTAASTQALPGGMSWVAYVNEAINACMTLYPRAVILLVHELPFRDTADTILANLRAVKEAVVAMRRAAGDTRLFLWDINESTFAGMPDPRRLYVDTLPGQGLSFGQLSDDDFCNHYTHDGRGHPNDLYNRLWLAPVFAHRLCLSLGIDPDTLPDTLRMPRSVV